LLLLLGPLYFDCPGAPTPLNRALLVPHSLSMPKHGKLQSCILRADRYREGPKTSSTIWGHGPFKISNKIRGTHWAQQVSEYLLTYGAEPFIRSCQLCSHSRTSQHFMEPEGSSPCSQEPSTGPYLEPDRSSP
jgi:hypothetical protein